MMQLLLILPVRLSVCFVMVGLMAASAQAQQETSAESLILSVEDEAARNLLSGQIGPWTIRDLNLPDEFVARIVGRSIRNTYRDRFHIVVRDDATIRAVGEDDNPVNRNATHESFEINRPTHWPVTLHETEGETAELKRLRRYREGIPSNRGFTCWPEPGPGPGSGSVQAAREQEVDIVNMSPAHRLACDGVGRRLARDGILWTTLQVIRELGDDWPEAEGAGEKLLAQLGVPVDMFRHFEPRSSRRHRRVGVIADMAGVVADESLTRESLADRFQFRWVPAHEKFVAMSESGDQDVGMARLQLTRSLYWAGRGSGDGLDVARQVVDSLPHVKFLLAVQRQHGPGVLEMLRTWAVDVGRSFELIETSHPLAQWAQDNGRGGTLDGASWATIVPRYASRREAGATFAPIESAVMERWGTLGHRVLRSSLLFQGGNLLCVQDPKSKSRILLLGEAGIYRNVALGLSPEQVRAAFAREFSVDRVMVLPAVSYHVDFDVSVRIRDGKLVALVNDPVLASRWIVAVCVGVLERAGVLDESNAARAKKAIAEGNDRNIVAIIGAAVRQKMVPTGGYPLTLAKHFSANPTDSGVGNLQRLLTAIDILAANMISSDTVGGDRMTRAYVRSIRRQLADMGELHDQLKAAGFEVVPVPSLSAGTRSVHYLNGVHTKDMYLVPVHGGLFESLDNVATESIRKALGGGVRIMPILSSESQRRDGAVHCSVCLYPKLSQTTKRKTGSK